jgi:hypothetical protein
VAVRDRRDDEPRLGGRASESNEKGDGDMRELTVDLFVTVDGFASGKNSPGYFGYAGP